ncbi:MAG: succinate-semialdehyde dehydrogenase, partial [Oscillospiraceae bacterium]
MTVQEHVEKARKALALIENYNQEQTDRLVYESAKIIYQNAEPLAKQAVAETRLGYVADKICKNTDTPAVFYDYLKDKRSVGIISEVSAEGIIEVA